MSLYGGRYKARRKHTFVASLAYTYAFKRIGLSEICLCFKMFNTEEEARYNEKTALLECSGKYGEPSLLNLELGRESTGTMNTPVTSKTYVFYELDRDLKEMLGV